MDQSASANGDEMASETRNIADDGDIIFIVGEERVRLRAHSLFITTVSPVFRAMLGPNFSEGQALSQSSTSSPVEIELPEDEPIAMETILNIIHGSNENVIGKIESHTILRVAITCDKYNCVESLMFAFHVWLRCGSQADSVDLWNIAMTSVVLHAREAFSDLTSRLILSHSGSFIDLATLDEKALDPVLLLRIAGRLEEIRNGFRRALASEVLSIAWSASSPAREKMNRAEIPEFLRPSPISTNTSLLDNISAVEQTKAFPELKIKAIMLRMERDHKVYNSGLCLRCIKGDGQHADHT